MRKKLLLILALFLSLATFAQVHQMGKNVRHEIPSFVKSMNWSKVSPTHQLQRQQFSFNQVLKADVAAGNYLAYFVGGFSEFYDIATAPTMTINGSTVELANLIPFEGMPAVKGTLNADGTITIAPQVLQKDALRLGDGTILDMVLGSLGASGEPVSFTLTPDEYGVYVTGKEDLVMIYGGSTSEYKGYLEVFIGLELSAMDKLIAYYTTNDLWNYGVSSDLVPASNASLMAAVSDKAQSIQFESYVAKIDNASVAWVYGEQQSKENVLEVPVSGTEMSFPISVAFYNGEQNKVAYGYPEGSMILVGGSSTVDGTDYGFSTFNPLYGLALPIKLNKDFGYGTGTFENAEGKELNVESVISYYPNKGANLEFKSLDAFLATQSETGQLVAIIYKCNLSTDGFPQFEENDFVAVSAPVDIANLGAEQTADGNRVGLVSFTKFYSDVERTTTLDKLSLNQSFIVIITGFNSVKAGLIMDGSSDYSRVVSGATENVFLMSGQTLLRKGYYKNAAIFFRGASIGTGGAGIESVTTNEDLIKAVFVNGAFELVYPEEITSVQIVNIAGQVVAEYTLEGTSATIPAANLAKGLYLLKFNTGTTVKVMK